MERQKPVNQVTVTKNGYTVTRPLTDKEWDLTARTCARDLTSYYTFDAWFTVGGPGSRRVMTNAYAQFVTAKENGFEDQASNVKTLHGI